MPLWICDVSECVNPTVRKGGCLLCMKRFCVVHLHAASHTCPTSTGDYEKWVVENATATKTEIHALMSRIDLDALSLRASSLRPGVSCEIPPLDPETFNSYNVMGGRHYHIPIVFADGVTWMARILRDNASSPPMLHLNLIMLSEVATLRFLSSTKVPVPAVHDFCLQGPGNPIGVGYILMDRVHGNTLNFQEATPIQRRRVLDQLAEIFIELERYPFDAIGSLCDPKNVTVGGCTDDEVMDLDERGNLRSFGPFTDNMTYLAAKITLCLELIRRREAYASCPVDAYLVHRYLQDTLLPSKHIENTSQPPFYLKHMDDKGDHILVDDNFNITAIIDWEWAQTVPKGDAFCSPLFLLDVGSFYDGENALSDHEILFAEILEDKGQHDMANLVRNSRLQHRIMFTVCGNVDDDFKKLFEGFLKVQPGRGNLTVDWDDWKSESLRNYADELDLLALIEEENGGHQPT